MLLRAVENESRSDADTAEILLNAREHRLAVLSCGGGRRRVDRNPAMRLSCNPSIHLREDVVRLPERIATFPDLDRLEDACIRELFNHHPHV